ncbi:hypothetical protein [Flagellimonas sp.]|uniref:hypothetical protein n=1 Tax=Flagellimonas sp. TaxID=2058762 RepID=UPI003F4A3DD6
MALFLKFETNLAMTVVEEKCEVGNRGIHVGKVTIPHLALLFLVDFLLQEQNR